MFVLLVVRASDKRIACDEEFSDSEDEGEGGARRDRTTFKRRRMRPDVEVKKDGEKKDEGNFVKDIN